MHNNFRTNVVRALGALCIAAAVAILVGHFGFASLDRLIVGLCVGLGTFLLTMAVH
jgi:1,4-dihydroxy-2-naphthoate octaprenyltransferase